MQAEITTFTKEATRHAEASQSTIDGVTKQHTEDVARLRTQHEEQMGKLKVEREQNLLSLEAVKQDHDAALAAALAKANEKSNKRLSDQEHMQGLKAEELKQNIAELSRSLDQAKADREATTEFNPNNVAQLHTEHNAETLRLERTVTELKRRFIPDSDEIITIPMRSTGFRKEPVYRVKRGRTLQFLAKRLERDADNLEKDGIDFGVRCRRHTYDTRCIKNHSKTFLEVSVIEKMLRSA